MVDSFDIEIRQVVRKYSYETGKARRDDPLSQALVAAADHEMLVHQNAAEVETIDVLQGWSLVKEQTEQVLTTPSPQILRSLTVVQSDSLRPALGQLNQQLRHAEERWAKFQVASGDSSAAATDGQTAPSIPRVLQAIEKAESLSSKRNASALGKAKKAVRGFLTTMDSYSNLFSVIPAQDKYVSVITGVIQSVTKASVTHEDNIDAYSLALEDITNDLETVSKSLKLCKSTRIPLLVVKLYIVVFDFLFSALEWHSSRRNRIKAAFKKTSTSDIQKVVKQVRTALDNIRFEAQQTTQERVSHTHDAVQRVERDMNDVKTVLGKLTEALVLNLGQTATETLLANGQAIEHARHALPGAITPTSDVSSPQSSGLENLLTMIDRARTPEPKNAPSTASLLLRLGPCLRPFDQDHQAEAVRDANTLTDPQLPVEVMQRIERWASEPISATLWIEGPTSTSAAQRLSVAAARIADTANKAQHRVPCIFFTPTEALMERVKPKDASSSERMLVALLYNLAGQLTLDLPEELAAPPADLGEGNFDDLDGSWMSVPSILEVIRLLLPYAPRIIMFVIDRFLEVECDTTSLYLAQLFSLLKEHGADRIIKVLIITNGGSVFLSDRLDYLDERVSAARMAPARDGRLRRGWTAVHNLDLPGASEG